MHSTTKFKRLFQDNSVKPNSLFMVNHIAAKNLQ